MRVAENKSMTVWDSQTVIYLSGKKTVCYAEEFICTGVTDAFIRIQTATNTDAASLEKKESKEFTEVNYKSSKPDKQNKISAPVRQLEFEKQSAVWVSQKKKMIFGNWKSKQHKIAAMQQAIGDV